MKLNLCWCCVCIDLVWCISISSVWSFDSLSVECIRLMYGSSARDVPKIIVERIFIYPRNLSFKEWFGIQELLSLFVVRRILTKLSAYIWREFLHLWRSLVSFSLGWSMDQTHRLNHMNLGNIFSILAKLSFFFLLN